MTTHATSTFEVKSWDEKPYDEVAGSKIKLTKASVRQSFHGDIEGEGQVEYLMAYCDDGTASFVGLLRVAGMLGNRSGSFVLQTAGTDDGNATKATWFVVPGTATGDLVGLRGEGGFSASRTETLPATLDYDLMPAA